MMSERMIAQILIFLLMADSAWVAYGLMRKRNMWAWIVAYWCVLTLKNIVEVIR